eukprot:6461376-Amphidinium_carterae.2
MQMGDLSKPRDSWDAIAPPKRNTGHRALQSAFFTSHIAQSEVGKCQSSFAALVFMFHCHRQSCVQQHGWKRNGVRCAGSNLYENVAFLLTQLPTLYFAARVQ